MQFVMPTLGKWITIACSLIIGIAALYWRKRILLPDLSAPNYISIKKKRNLLVTVAVLALWFFSGLVIGCFTSGTTTTFQVEISPTRVDLLGFSVSSTVIIAWIVIAALVLAAALIRIFVIPRFQETPRGLQLVLETAVGAISKLTNDKCGRKNEGLASYFFALAALLLGSAIIELFGFRPPTTDLSMTFSYAIVTFILINVYGVHNKGLKGRLRSFTSPNAVILPFKILSDLAVPISLACRLFGNMLGGMVVVELIYFALGAFSVGVPAVLGLYFNAFHPLIQFFIFINLSLTFIGEAMEAEEE